MIKYISKVSLLLALTFFIGCSDDKKTFDVDGGITAFHFTTATKAVGVSPLENTTSVDVGVTTRSNSERTYQVSVIDEETSAADGSFTVNTSSLVIQPNSYTGSFEVSFDFDLIPASGSVNVALLLTPSSGSVLIGKEKIVLSVSRLCPLGTQSIAGNHSYFSFGPLKRFLL
jgi:hypothetical protein